MPPGRGGALADAHLHLQDPRLAENLAQILAEARVLGIREMGVCGTSPADWPEVSRLAAAEYGLHPSFGVHPWQAGRLPEDWPARLEGWLRRHPGAGVGEIGLDAARRDPPAALQRRVLEAQLDLARRLGRPVSLHAVRALPAVLGAVRALLPPGWAFLLHDCRASAEQVREIVRMGGYVSCGVALLDPRARRAWDAARAVSPDRLLVETDAPDRLTPGGCACPGAPALQHPANLVSVVAALARLRGWTPAAAAARTAENARRFWAFRGTGVIQQG